jgi:hypothetical protein
VLGDIAKRTSDREAAGIRFLQSAGVFPFVVVVLLMGVELHRLEEGVGKGGAGT